MVLMRAASAPIPINRAERRALIRTQKGQGRSDPRVPRTPSLRRPRRQDVVIYRVRVDLDHARPPIWRRLDVLSDLRLDEMHAVLQAAMGWDHSHLHEFSLRSGRRRSERYAPPSPDDLGDDVIPTEQVRLDEVLQELGDELHYTYDFGDSWEHTVRLEEILPEEEDSPAVKCVKGVRACPPEDCGGVWGYEAMLDYARGLAAGSTLADEDAQELLMWLFPGMSAAQILKESAACDVRAVNARLASVRPR